MPASDAAGERVVGIVQRGATNATGAAGAVSVDVEKAVARLNNSAAHPLDITKCEQLCYVEDDNTVSASGGANNVVAGRLLELDPADPTMAWVDTSRTS